jgi:hypothetical protein
MYYEIFHYKNGSKTDTKADTKRKKYMETHAHAYIQKQHRDIQRQTHTITVRDKYWRRETHGYRCTHRHGHAEASLRTFTQTPINTHKNLHTF